MSEVVPISELYRENGEFLQRYLVRRGLDAATSEDIVQEVFIMADKLGGYAPGPATARTWLCAIATRLGANAYRRLKNKQRLIFIPPSIEVHGSDVSAPDILFSKRCLSEKVQEALASMTLKHRECLLNFYVDGLTCEEMAQIEGVPTGTIYSRMHSARIRFICIYSSLR